MRSFYSNSLLVQYALYFACFATLGMCSSYSVATSDDGGIWSSPYLQNRARSRGLQNRFRSTISSFTVPKSPSKLSLEALVQSISDSIDSLSESFPEAQATVCFSNVLYEFLGSEESSSNIMETDNSILTVDPIVRPPATIDNEAGDSEYFNIRYFADPSTYRPQSTRFPGTGHVLGSGIHSETVSNCIFASTNPYAMYDDFSALFHIAFIPVVIFCMYRSYSSLWPASTISIILTADDSSLVPTAGNSLYLIVPLSDDGFIFLNSLQDYKPVTLITSKSNSPYLDINYIKFCVFDVSSSQKDRIQKVISNDNNEYIALKISSTTRNALIDRVRVLERLYTTGMFHRGNTKLYSPNLDTMSRSLIHVTVTLKHESFWQKHLISMLELVEYFETRLDITFSDTLNGYSAFVTPQEIEMIKSLPGVSDAFESIFLCLDSYSVLSADEASKHPNPSCYKESLTESSLWHLSATGIIGEDHKKKKIISKDDEKDAIILLIDSGIYSSHEDLNISIVPDNRYAYSVYDGESPYNDALGHGTQLAGIMKGQVVGIAPDAHKIQVVPIRIFSDAGCEIYKDSEKAYKACNLEPKILTHDKIHKALAHILKLLKENNNEIRDKICIINYSINGTESPDIFNHIVEEILEFPNVYFVASAGNNGLSTDKSDPGKFYPGMIKNTRSGERLVLAAASIVSNDNKEMQKIYPSSGYGSLVQFLAPGELIYSSFKDSQIEKGCFAPLYGTSPATSFVSTLFAIIGSKLKIKDGDNILNQMLKYSEFKDVSNENHTQEAYVVTFNNFIEPA